MSPTRRLAAIGLVATAMAAIFVPTAWAGVGPDGWTLENGVITGAGDVITVAGDLTPPTSGPTRRVTRIDITLRRIADASSACPATVAAPSLSFPENDDDPEWADSEPPNLPAGRTQEFTVDVSVPCNGSYAASLTAVADRAGPPEPVDDDIATEEPIDIPGGVDVANAPPAIPLIASVLGGDRNVVVAWQPPAGWGTANACTIDPAGPPDFLGYEVRRSIDGGPVSKIASPGPGTQCFSDPITPASAFGTYRYDVVARRGGVSGEIVSAVATTTVAVGPPPATPEPATPTTAFGPPTAPVQADAGPGSTGGTGSGAVPSTPDDGTFEETLDYGEEPGELAADVPDDAEAFLDFVPGPGAGILEPVAIAACLAAWAMHLRYLARRADDGF